MQRIGRSIRSHRDKTVELSLDRTAPSAPLRAGEGGCSYMGISTSGYSREY